MAVEGVTLKEVKYFKLQKQFVYKYIIFHTECFRCIEKQLFSVSL